MIIDERKIVQYDMDMSEYANGAAQYFSALFGGRFVTREQAHDMANFFFAQTKRNIENCPFAFQEERDAEIRRRVNLINMFRLQMGL